MTSPPMATGHRQTPRRDNPPCGWKLRNVHDVGRVQQCAQSTGLERRRGRMQPRLGAAGHRAGRKACNRRRRITGTCVPRTACSLTCVKKSSSCANLEPARRLPLQNSRGRCENKRMRCAAISRGRSTGPRLRVPRSAPPLGRIGALSVSTVYRVCVALFYGRAAA
jgi:hypothetical protein